MRQILHIDSIILFNSLAFFFQILKSFEIPNYDDKNLSNK